MLLLSDQSLVIPTPRGPVLLPARVRHHLGLPGLMPGASWCCRPEELMDEIVRALAELSGCGIHAVTASRTLGTTGLIPRAAIEAAGALAAVQSLPITAESRGIAARREGLLQLDVSLLSSTQRRALVETPTATLTIGLRPGIPRIRDRSPEGVDARAQWAEAQRIAPEIMPDPDAARLVMMAHVGAPAPRVLQDALYRKPRHRLSPAEKRLRDASESESRAFWHAHVLASESLAPWAPALVPGADRPAPRSAKIGR